MWDMHVLAEYDKGHANRQGIGAHSCVVFREAAVEGIASVRGLSAHAALCSFSFFISFCLIFFAM